MARTFCRNAALVMRSQSWSPCSRNAAPLWRAHGKVKGKPQVQRTIILVEGRNHHEDDAVFSQRWAWSYELGAAML